MLQDHLKPLQDKKQHPFLFPFLNFLYFLFFLGPYTLIFATSLSIKTSNVVQEDRPFFPSYKALNVLAFSNLSFPNPRC